MKIQVELTHEIINAMSPEDCKEALRQLITEVKTDVDTRIAKIKAEIGDTIPSTEKDKVVERLEISQEIIQPKFDPRPLEVKDFHHGSQQVSDSLIKEIQQKYNKGNRSLMMIMNQDYPDIKYRTIYEHIKIKKKPRK